jgi:hypothetical protein
LKKNSLKELKLDFKKFISKKLIKLNQQKSFKEINLKFLKRFPSFKKITLKLILELKKQFEDCKIIQIGEKSYNIQII